MKHKAQWILAATVAIVMAGAALAAAAVVNDGTRETNALRDKPELDIVRATSGIAVGEELRVKHKITMRGKLKPESKNTRPFILINTKGGGRSDFEYVVLGPRVFRSTKDGFEKVGANQFSSRKRTWVYRFKTSTFGSPSSYGWAALTSKGRTSDLAPADAYKVEDLP
jgi:hypothetical protein